ncbi:hypothetical protein OG936_16315 [Streptomyces sp. NBC_00846]|uniref:hypothetical protein n=1 Tax=Streptomyces sp. NBC_00846 TaxID=2975849 RepID=UPI003870A824|nr:hypothetical protein OG936_16315 [Streptomyces sp. NBC_00846]
MFRKGLRTACHLAPAKDLAELLGQVPDHHGVDRPSVARSVTPPPSADPPAELLDMIAFSVHAEDPFGPGPEGGRP